ncbi:MAG: cyclopropane-fatty-acyl-phospholipid synthase [Pirellulaceae bacterium]|nr:cyclopropane-fatty-acyl-phospholipid synthase [Pirellulaceae bacterium]
MPVLPPSQNEGSVRSTSERKFGQGSDQGWLTDWSRQLLFQRLGSLGFGQLEIVEGGDRHVFGSDANRLARLEVNDSSFYRHVVMGGALGAAESFLQGHWVSDDLVAVFRLLAINSTTFQNVNSSGRLLLAPVNLIRRLITRNSQSGSRKNIHAHYDLGNEFFKLFLDSTMTYSSGIFVSPQSSLRESSIEKYDLICRKLRLEHHHQLVEIGTGWGGFAIHAAAEYGCRVTTTTISQEQFQYARAAVEKAGVADRVEIVCKDYRNLQGQYDRLVSIEMIEAVGHQFLPAYFQQCSRLLKNNGEMLIQAITIPDQFYDDYRKSIDFIQRYIFPGGCLPCLSAITDAVKRKTDLQLVGLDDYTPHYARTLQLWRERFLGQLDSIHALGLDDRFIRMWDYYLAYCEAGFRERMTALLQLHFAKPNAHGFGLTFGSSS